MAESKGFFGDYRRLRVATLLDHVGENSPPDCFLPQATLAPSLFESLATNLTKNKEHSFRYTLYFLAESKGFEPSNRL